MCLKCVVYEEIVASHLSSIVYNKPTYADMTILFPTDRKIKVNSAFTKEPVFIDKDTGEKFKIINKEISILQPFN